jgi:hypothetical protein
MIVFPLLGFVCWFVGPKLGDKSHIEILYDFYVQALQNVFFKSEMWK